MGVEFGGSSDINTNSFKTFLETTRERDDQRFKKRYREILDSQHESTRIKIYQLITNERHRQDYIHGPNLETPLAVLGEEFGEVCKAIFEGDEEDLREELVHVAAVCVKWLEILEEE